MTDQTPTITEGTRLRVQPGGNGENDPAYLAQALGEPHLSEVFGARVVRVKFLSGPRVGGTDYIAMTHVEVAPVEVPRPTLPEAREARDAAVAQVAEGKEHTIEAILAAVTAVAARKRRFIADDVWNELVAQGVTIGEGRVVGPAMQRAVREGLAHLASCDTCGTVKVMTTGRSRASHAQDVPVYEAGPKPAVAGTPLERAKAAQRAYLEGTERLAQLRREAFTEAKESGETYRSIATFVGLKTQSNVHSIVTGKG